MNFLDILKSKLSVQGSKDFEQNADRVVPQGTANIPYNSGISEQDAYKLALEKQAQDANAKAAYDKQMIDNYNASRQYQDDARLLKQVGWDTPEAYKAIVRSDMFDDRIDQGLAAQWQNNYRGR